ncbi:MAG: Holliday junction branch migration protein RuvA [Bacteroidetes bacterium]|nr:Holliday junction branch migration protein RuvA [Bacteroidota bacterium]
MIAFLQGEIVRKSPTLLLLNVGGVGYEIHISLHTYGLLPDEGTCKILTYLSIREDAHVLFGFAEANEKVMFQHLLSVQGIGPQSARTVLSSTSPLELQDSIRRGAVHEIQRIKGIGPKTAQRLVLDLRDRVNAMDSDETTPASRTPGESRTKVHEEALLALVALGFSRPAMEKSLQTILAQTNAPSDSQGLIKAVLNNL